MNEMSMTEKFRIRFGTEYPLNCYGADGECRNCHNKESILVKKGVRLDEVKILCPRCEAVTLEVYS